MIKYKPDDDYYSLEDELSSDYTDQEVADMNAELDNEQ